MNAINIIRGVPGKPSFSLMEMGFRLSYSDSHFSSFGLLLLSSSAFFPPPPQEIEQ